MPHSDSTNQPPEHPWPSDAGPVLTGLARAAITAGLAHPGEPAPAGPTAVDHPWLAADGASFVTLTAAGRLRGCIGSVAARRPLGEDVAGNARAAAFADRRFRPVTAPELPGIHVEVSVLSSPVPMTVTGEADALAQLRPRVDGVLLEYGGHRATFLPQVWELVDGAPQFLARLRAKAHLPERFWHPDLRLSRYTVTAFEEPS